MTISHYSTERVIDLFESNEAIETEIKRLNDLMEVAANENAAWTNDDLGKLAKKVAIVKRIQRVRNSLIGL